MGSAVSLSPAIIILLVVLLLFLLGAFLALLREPALLLLGAFLALLVQPALLLLALTVCLQLALALLARLLDLALLLPAGVFLLALERRFLRALAGGLDLLVTFLVFPLLPRLVGRILPRLLPDIGPGALTTPSLGRPGRRPLDGLAGRLAERLPVSSLAGGPLGLRRNWVPAGGRLRRLGRGYWPVRYGGKQMADGLVVAALPG
jgi:hypothetical protein